MPELGEVRARVEQEARRAQVAKREREATQQIVDGYDIDLVYRQPGDKLARLNTLTKPVIEAQ